MKSLDDISTIIEKSKPYLKEKYYINEIGIFGSHVTGKNNEKSDVDILVNFSKAPSFFKFLEIEDFLSDLLGMKVDLVVRRALKPNIGKNILKEVIYI